MSSLCAVPAIHLSDEKLQMKNILLLSKQNHELGINQQFSHSGFKYLKAYNYLSNQYSYLNL